MINVGVLGATGAVGSMMLKVLEERKFPVGELRLYASSKSKGKKVVFNNKEYTIEDADEADFNGLDVVFGAVGNNLAEKYAPLIVKTGALFIDNSSSYRMDPNVPLVVPEINPEDIFKHKGIIANPNCSTIIALMGVAPINKLSKIKHMVASTYQAVSGAGVYGIKELNYENNEIAKINEATGEENPKVERLYDTFPYQIASNLIPQISTFLDNGYTKEEMKMQNEGRKILHNDNMLVNCTCVRVGVIRSHSISITLVTEDKLDLDDVRNAIKNQEGVVLYDDPENKIYPMPLLTSDQDLVYVGRIRRDLINENGISLFICGDQIRKGAATNAVDIAVKYFKI